MAIEEPAPRDPPGEWEPYSPPIFSRTRYPKPSSDSSAVFIKVLNRRRSDMGKSVSWEKLSELLWHATGIRRVLGIGRAAMPIQQAPSPSAGGLGSISIVCISDDISRPRLYDPMDNSFAELSVDAESVNRLNRRAVEATTGLSAGCTLRFVADLRKISAAYHHPESLILRESGYLGATIGLCATWLSMTACPLGFIGDELTELLGFPRERFIAVGAVQIGLALE